MKNSKIYTLSIAALIAIGSLTACQKSAAPAGNATNQNMNQAANKTTPAANENSATANSAPKAAADTAPKADISPSSVSNSTPTETYKALYAARKTKDVATMKKLISKEMYEFFEILGEGKPNPLEAGLLELASQPQGATDEVRNEKISGDKATLQFLNPNGKWTTADLVKEDGGWKMTIEKADK